MSGRSLIQMTNLSICMPPNLLTRPIALKYRKFSYGLDLTDVIPSPLTCYLNFLRRRVATKLLTPASNSANDVGSGTSFRSATSRIR